MAKQKIKAEKPLLKDTGKVNENNNVVVDTPSTQVLTEQPQKNVVQDTPIVTEDTIAEEVKHEQEPEPESAPAPTVATVFRRSHTHDGGVHF